MAEEVSYLAFCYCNAGKCWYFGSCNVFWGPMDLAVLLF